MTLENISLQDRRKLTKSYPVLISAFPNSGKSAAVEFLSAEDKARTVIYDLEGKGLPEDSGQEYRRVIKLKNFMDTSLDYLYKNEGTVKYRDIVGVMDHMRKTLADPGVDRIIIDSFSTLVDEYEKYYVMIHNGYTTYTKYNTELYTWFRMLKEETFTHAKFVYALGHYIPAKSIMVNGKPVVDSESEKFTKVKGKDHYRMVESHFNTVLTIEGFKFIADNLDETNSTRIRRSLNPLSTNENSLTELELLLTK